MYICTAREKQKTQNKWKCCHRNSENRRQTNADVLHCIALKKDVHARSLKYTHEHRTRSHAEMKNRPTSTRKLIWLTWIYSALVHLFESHDVGAVAAASSIAAKFFFECWCFFCDCFCFGCFAKHGLHSNAIRESSTKEKCRKIN